MSRNLRKCIEHLPLMNKEVTFCKAAEARAEDKAQVKLVSILFRHGDRTPDVSIGESYPTQPELDPKNNYFPVGPGGLTNEGKLRLYNFGQTLRKKYDKFLGPLYYPSVVESRSTDYERTKMSLQLVLNGLFPPAPCQQWRNGVDWQPIPTLYARKEDDWILRPDLNPKALAATKRYEKTPEYQKRFSDMKELGKYLEKITNKSYENILDLALLYVTLAREASMGKELPAWSKDLFPNGRLLKAGTFYFDAQSVNDEIRRLHGGALLRKITDDFASCRNGTLEEGKKLYLYSAHDLNVAGLLGALGIWKSHMPEFSSAVIIELLECDGEYFIKIIHYLGIPPTFVEMRLPGCEKLCPMDKFMDVLKHVIPTDEDLNRT
ncbi:venom acid phosphatase Acph-1-like isoform X2 [Athalia rosae]|uniref:venom acid phosphatase Acph-1-like isoform X2 n=1 Tax=Athalia rosae TaxID=37344 RepID=UPI0020337525|nr:venom acid phosphatase Acph-1-like isoform X2 [Athalia rosae]